MRWMEGRKMITEAEKKVYKIGFSDGYKKANKDCSTIIAGRIDFIGHKKPSDKEDKKIAGFFREIIRKFRSLTPTKKEND